MVLASASRFIHANISTSFVDASCAITGTRPFASHLTLSSQSTAEGFTTSQPHRNALIGHEALGLAHGVFAVVEGARGQYRVRVAVLDAVGQMLQRADAARGDHRNRHRVGHRPCEGKIEATLGAV